MLDRKLEREVRHRGEVIANCIRNGIPDGIGTGISPLHLMIVFRGQIPQHQGGGGSNNAAITALEHYQRSEAAVFGETVRVLCQIYGAGRVAIDTWLRFYIEDGSQNAKADRAGVSRATYIQRLKYAEALIAGALVSGGYYKTKEVRELC